MPVIDVPILNSLMSLILYADKCRCQRNHFAYYSAINPDIFRGKIRAWHDVEVEAIVPVVDVPVLNSLF